MEHSGFIDKFTVKKEGKHGISNDVCMYTGTEDMKRFHNHEVAQNKVETSIIRDTAEQGIGVLTKERPQTRRVRSCLRGTLF
jgi:hypothetical protein